MLIFNTKIRTQSVAFVPSSQLTELNLHQDWYETATLLNGEPAFDSDWNEYITDEPSYKMIDIGNTSAMAVNFNGVIRIIVTPELIDSITNKILAQELKEKAEKAKFTLSSSYKGYLTLKYSEDVQRDEYDNKHFTEYLSLKLNDQILHVTCKYQ